MKNSAAHRPMLQTLAIILLIVGICFRFTNLGEKVFWIDEAATSFRISGYSEVEFMDSFTYDRIIGAKEFDKYQQPSPEKNSLDVIKNLAAEEPQLSPLYFVILRTWTDWFGSAIVSVRLLSVVISLLIFPCLYWLCIELFQSAQIAWMAVAIVAVSPFHVLFAQEARPYALHTLTIVLSSAVLLKAIRQPNKLNWMLYAATIASGLYSFLLFALVAIAHGIYVGIREITINKFHSKKILIHYLLASAAGFIASIPWLAIVVINSSRIPQLDETKIVQKSGLAVLRDLAGGIRQIFFDLNSDAYASNIQIFAQSFDLHPLTKILYPVFNLLFLGLIGYAAYIVARKTSQQVWLFVGSIGIVGLVFLIALEKLLPRYSIATYLSLEILVAFLLAVKLLSPEMKRTKKLFWRITATLLIAMGILSCYVSSQAETWWSKGNSHDITLANIINQSPKPLIVSDAFPIELLSIGHYLNEKVRLQIQSQCGFCVASPTINKPITFPKIPDTFSSLFLFLPSKTLKNELEKTYQVSPLQEYDRGDQSQFINVWRLTQKSN
ncbi:MAG: hypothetical protein HC780_04335 [Leptolyngbyaceae cyanobacterium CSU_1_3]|nr:hypothetical protein [Leptolyngbyaceae cyanobacterium CSU_1_3]